MLSLDIQTLAQQVHTILADPTAPVPVTGDTALNEALTALAVHRRAHQSLPDAHVLGYWH